MFQLANHRLLETSSKDKVIAAQTLVKLLTPLSLNFIPPFSRFWNDKGLCLCAKMISWYYAYYLCSLHHSLDTLKQVSYYASIISITLLKLKIQLECKTFILLSMFFI